MILKTEYFNFWYLANWTVLMTYTNIIFRFLGKASIAQIWKKFFTGDYVNIFYVKEEYAAEKESISIFELIFSIYTFVIKQQ